MKGYEGPEQIDIFNLDILLPLRNIDKNKYKEEKKLNAAKRVELTLKISDILDLRCAPCKHQQNCGICPFQIELSKLGKEYEQTTNHKIHKEHWDNRLNDKNDPNKERLYTFETIQDLEEKFKPQDILEMRKRMRLVEIARKLDCEYTLIKSYVNKYKISSSL